jgi:prefoldin subunit 5
MPGAVAPPAASAANELTVLKQQSEMFTRQLEAVRDRIAELEKEEETK